MARPAMRAISQAASSKRRVSSESLMTRLVS
jgi:hypothetical protein